MLEFLTKQNHTRNYPVESVELPNKKEVDVVKKSISQRIDDFTVKNSFQGKKSVAQYSLKCLSQLARDKEISQGAFFISQMKDDKPVVKYISGFASPDPEDIDDILELGEGFPGQVAKDGNIINISDMPEGYLTIESGLGKAAPVSLILFPVKHDDKVLAVIELASFHKFDEDDEQFFIGISPSIAEQILKCTSGS